MRATKMINRRALVATTTALLATRRIDPRAFAAGAAVDPTRHRAFADELTGAMYANDNECSSALGVSMALSLVYPGCAGDAIEQLRDALGYPSGSNSLLAWEETTKDMLSDSTGDSGAPLLRIANGVWLDDDITLSAAYDSAVGDYKKQIDFEADGSPAIVNEWVKNSTNGLIESIVPEGKSLSPPYVLIAINSIYLKASWKEQFQESKTNLDSFHGSPSRNGEASEAHFMNMVDFFYYSHAALPDYQVIDLPFAASRMSMIFALPMSDGGGTVSSTDLLPALEDLERTRIALSVPKFKFESTYDDALKEGLIQSGIVAPFTAGSGALCGLFEEDDDCESLVIDKIVQKTVIDVNEKGVEAAAVTGAMVSATSVITDDPILMQLDHPFQFFVYDKSEGLVLFEGRVGAPEVPESEPDVALLDLKHSDDDFWYETFGVDVNLLAGSFTVPAPSPTASGAKKIVAMHLHFLACALVFFGSRYRN